MFCLVTRLQVKFFLGGFSRNSGGADGTERRSNEVGFHLDYKFLARQIYFKIDRFVRVLRRLVI